MRPIRKLDKHQIQGKCIDLSHFPSQSMQIY